MSLSSKLTGLVGAAAWRDTLAAASDRLRAGIFGPLFKTSLVSAVYSFLTEDPVWAALNLELLDHLPTPIPERATILDLGAGTGIGTVAMGQALDGRAQVIGLDFSEQMIERAKARLARGGPGNVRFQQGDATDLSGFVDGSMDFVVANSFLYLVADPAGVLAEVRRVLAPAGWLVFMEPRQDSSLIQAATAAWIQHRPGMPRPAVSPRLVAAMVAWRIVSGIEGRPTEAQLTRLFHEAGFQSVRFEPTLGGLGHHVIARGRT